MSSRLCIDVGNTRSKVSILADTGEELLSYVCPWLEASIVTTFIKMYKVHSAAACQSGVLAESIAVAIRSLIPLIVLDHKTKVPITNLYRTPETLGRDRLAAAVGAYAIFPNQNCIIIDAGTCITYDVLNAKGEYLGGNIAPGINMRLKAMDKFTSRLPTVPPLFRPDFIGTTTEEAMQNGAVWGAIFEFESFIKHVNQNIGDSKVILTGGDADYFANQTKMQIFAHPNIVLLGLNEILKFNDL